MKTTFKTQQELVADTKALIENATLQQYKWMYCYLQDLDEWPLVTNQVKAAQHHMPLVTDESETE